MFFVEVGGAEKGRGGGQIAFTLRYAHIHTHKKNGTQVAFPVKVASGERWPCPSSRSEFFRVSESFLESFYFQVSVSRLLFSQRWPPYSSVQVLLLNIQKSAAFTASRSELRVPFTPAA